MQASPLNLPLTRPILRHLLLECLFLGASVFIILVVFQPFGTYTYSNPNKYWQLAGYSIITVLLHGMLKIIWLRATTTSTFKRDVIFMLLALLAISLVSFIYHARVIMGSFVFARLPYFVLYSFGIGLFPYTMLLYDKWLRAKQGIAITAPTPEPSDLILTGDNRYETLKLTTNSILYIKSQGNYAEVHFLYNNQPKQMLLRTSLAALQAQIPYTYIVSVHRSYIVNIRHFSILQRIGGKPVLKSKLVTESLPVSRTKLAGTELALRDFSTAVHP